MKLDDVCGQVLKRIRNGEIQVAMEASDLREVGRQLIALADDYAPNEDGSPSVFVALEGLPLIDHTNMSRVSRVSFFNRASIGAEASFIVRGAAS